MFKLLIILAIITGLFPLAGCQKEEKAAGPPPAPIVEVVDGTLLEEQTVVVEDLALGQWLLDLSVWRIEPNPPHETIVLRSDPMWGAVIDQVVVQTICIPEPLTISFLALGGLFLRRRRR